MDFSVKTYTEIAKEVIKKIDFCSGVPELNIAHCCKDHDNSYVTTGKFKADWLFFKCMNKKASTYGKIHKRVLTHAVAGIYFVGVSIFGWLPYIRAKNV